ncbi:hypothetical protein [Carnobacterium maltaromaticum]|uniref:hypothetical protein n=1 Tax=Carnobacterium maltaromaticum TaxID=2751 RepID=UPI001072A184|nr:hypothetical protein [Carnobacterium maltaromaticum]TFJ76588.1 hypothetical protein CKN94_01900 [Carnobacterium maltaromaticum]TFJ79388.1 hypothetical protein CKN97_01895 [Carnobacterium maltaromaticum]
MYFGEPNPPEITLDKKEYSLYKYDETIDITGTIFDKDSLTSTFYTQYPDGTIKKEQSISLEREVTKAMAYAIDVSKLEAGVNKLKIWAEDPMRINSEEIEVVVNVFEVTATPNMKKLKKDSLFQVPKEELISNVQSLNPAILELTQIADTSKIGFDHAVVSVTDSIRTEQTNDIKVPINIYGPNTAFDDMNHLALNAQDVWLSQAKVKGTMNLTQLIYDQIKPKSWHTWTGLPYNTAVTTNTVKVPMGSYQAEIAAKNEKNQVIKKSVNVHVVGGKPVIKSDVQNQSVIVRLGDEYKIAGTVIDQDSPEYTVSYKLDQSDSVPLVTSYDNTETYNQEVPFSGSIPQEKLELGIHTISVTVMDLEGNQATIEFELNVKGELAFKQLPPETLSFPNVKISDKSKLIKTTTPIEMIVEDYRGIGTEWKIMGTLIHEMQDRESQYILKNSLLFIDENEQETLFRLDEGIILAQGKTSKSTHEFPIKWEQEQGIAIKIPLGAKKGIYEGVMDLTLVDAP